jgi:hypothetical protein
MMKTNRKTMFKVLLMVMALFVSGVLAGCSYRNAQHTTDTVSILFVGNSHTRTGYVPSQLQELARLHGIKVTYVDVSINYVSLYNETLRENAMKEMQNRRFDYVVIQARSQAPVNDIDGFFDDIRFFSELIREHGATPVLYSPAWDNENGQPSRAWAALTIQAHEQAAYENDIILINAGDAWVYAFRTTPYLSLFARDEAHANHAGAFLTTSVFMATLFDLQVENIPTGNIIDNVPMLNILTFLGIVLTIGFVIYRITKKQPLHLIKAFVIMISFAALQFMAFSPHVFRFTEGGNRLILLYTVIFGLAFVALCSTYYLVRTKFIEKQSWNIARKYIFCILACVIIYGLTFIPIFELRIPLYRGENAIDLAQAAWNFVNSR